MNNKPTPHPHPTRIAIIGTGYVGLTTAACFAHLGHHVLALDTDETKIDALKDGHIPILESRLDALVADGIHTGRLTFSTDYHDVAQAEVIMLCLPTPYNIDTGLDLTYIKTAAASLRPVLNPDSIVVTKSTVPVGTHKLLTGWLSRPDVHVAANPEFLREGTAVNDFLSPDRIVIGATSNDIGHTIANLYSTTGAPTHVTDPTSAELIKYAANTYLAAKISFVNEMSRLCDHIGADIESICDGLGSDHRIGKAFLSPGPGWGGSCFPKDTRGLTHLARENGQHLPVAEAAHHSNQLHLDHITSRIIELSPVPIADSKVAVWGTAFKAGTDDTRDSPALDIIERLIVKGATVTAYDPAADPGLRADRTADDPYSACRDANLLVVLTEWPEFAAANLQKVADLLDSPVVYDTRAVIDPSQAKTAGLQLHRSGRPNVVP